MSDVRDADNLDELLGRLYRAWTAHPELPFRAGTGRFSHPAWPPNTSGPTNDQIRQLNHLGCVRVEQGGMGVWNFVLTSEGELRGREASGADEAVSGGHSISLEWIDAVRLLETLTVSYEQLSAADDEVPLVVIAQVLECSPADTRLAQLVKLLYRDGYLDLTEQFPFAASSLVPSPRTLQMLRGWPSADPELIAERLDQALAAAIERADDPEQKDRLRRLRASAGDVTKSVLAGAILAVGKGMV